MNHGAASCIDRAPDASTIIAMIVIIVAIPGGSAVWRRDIHTVVEFIAVSADFGVDIARQFLILRISAAATVAAMPEGWPSG